mmetsp:Transcript_15048/g.34890  ORF Transcript_15048/g.34890 Transcript_15048/m.34890 type:complete len:440 (+) Transcript_15048:273-1592(+)|eukprot:CAMPEP_0197177130 /NCGR_PEP_ID=MMETSP1423-20130617/2848_1 /TAXON_ID=476441 /ORGANISM="Pseudo-nitzschia heimii, Strain UNC1101" /LENGTH=439 /DNA_ID=CAMNT_0042626637 /DNA_START=231 /DNA_END=1550 /DNA_ORIENTATION=-
MERNGRGPTSPLQRSVVEITIDHSRDLHDDLPHRGPPQHVLDGVGDGVEAREGPGLVDDGPQRALLVEVHDASRRLADIRRPGVSVDRLLPATDGLALPEDLGDVEADVRLLRLFSVVVGNRIVGVGVLRDVPDLEEPALRGEAVEGRLQHPSPDALEDAVEAVRGDPSELLPDVLRRSVVDDVVAPEVLQEPSLVFGSAGPDHGASRQLRELDGEVPGASGGRRDQNGLTRSDLPGSLQHGARGQSGDPQPDALRGSGRDLPDGGGLGDVVLGEGASDEAHGVPDRNAIDLASDGRHDPDALGAEAEGRPALVPDEGVLAAGPEGLAASVDPGVPDADQDLVLPELGRCRCVQLGHPRDLPEARTRSGADESAKGLRNRADNGIVVVVGGGGAAALGGAAASGDGVGHGGADEDDREQGGSKGSHRCLLVRAVAVFGY